MKHTREFYEAAALNTMNRADGRVLGEYLVCLLAEAQVWATLACAAAPEAPSRSITDPMEES